MEFLGFRISHRTFPLILAFGFCFWAMYVSAQEAKPNLTGNWKLNLRKSKLSSRHPPGDEIYAIQHSEPRLEMTHIFNARSERYSYLIDGKERVVHRSSQEGELRAKVYWDGDILVMEKNQGSTIWTSRYNLSQGGKGLTLTQHITKSDFGGRFDELLVFEKQR